MQLQISNHPSRRGGVVATRPNNRNEKAAANLARIWATRNLSLSARSEIQKAHDALLEYGVTITDNWTYASTLLKRLVARLEQAN